VRTLSERGLDSVGGLVLGDEAHNPIVDLVWDFATRIVEGNRKVSVAMKLLALRLVLVVVLDFAE
jgi:hypothetical protein